MVAMGTRATAVREGATVVNRVTRDAIVAEARTWLGTPYHDHASVRGVGCDCTGLHRGIAEALALAWPAPPEEHQRVLQAPDWMRHTRREYFREVFEQCPCLTPVSCDALVLGDTLLFGWGMMPCSHAAIVIETAPPLRFIHAHYRRAVMEEVLTAPWQRVLCCAFTLREEE